MRKSIRPGSLVWPLVKVAGFWCVFAQGALILAYTLDISPVRLVYFATAAFGLQSVGLLLGSLMAYGFSWRLGVYAVACVAVGIGICSMLPTVELDGAAGSSRISRGNDQSENNQQSGGGRGQPAGSVRPVDNLSGAAELIFGKETEESLAEARRYLLSIPERSRGYRSAQALLHVIENRLEEINIQKGGASAPLEIVAFEQTGHGLRVTLRNNSGKSIRNIRFRLSYFGVADGTQIEPDMESLIARDVPPRVTWTFELSSDSAKGNAYAAFTVLGWDVAPTL